MRWLIDGYNIMHAAGRLGPKLGRGGFLRARRRFLGELADALGADRAARTTVVFDASVPPSDFPAETTYRGLRVIFALDDEDADGRIERIIRAESKPKDLTVVSSDRRIRQAAARRRAQPMTADDFWVWIDDLRAQAAAGAGQSRREVAGPPAPVDGADGVSTAERDYWLETFRDLDESPEIRQTLAPHSDLITDAEIAAIQREVDREP
jgi:predicted RNA-binding protein with PIN domain